MPPHNQGLEKERGTTEVDPLEARLADVRQRVEKLDRAVNGEDDTGNLGLRKKVEALEEKVTAIRESSWWTSDNIKTLATVIAAAVAVVALVYN